MELSNLQEGMIIQYILPLSMRLTQPQKRWRGVILRVYRSSFGTVIGGVKVRILEPGYEEDTELVFPYQIKAIE